jgi:hypothetical protein
MDDPMPRDAACRTKRPNGQNRGRLWRIRKSPLRSGNKIYGCLVLVKLQDEEEMNLQQHRRPNRSGTDKSADRLTRLTAPSNIPELLKIHAHRQICSTSPSRATT